MAKTSSSDASTPKKRRISLDPFNGILGVFFLVLAIVSPVAMPAADNRMNVLHYIGITVCCLISAFFFWRWLRAQFAHALRNVAAEEVVETRARTFAQDAAAAPPSVKP
jgi:protein-S-isoprenylcysteine O-methyltransferase Ste14